jgi:hypothetical protein
MSVHKQQPDAVEGVDLRDLGFDIDIRANGLVSVMVDRQPKRGRTKVTLHGPGGDWIIESDRDRVLERNMKTGGLHPRSAEELPDWADAVLQHCNLDKEVS